MKKTLLMALITIVMVGCKEDPKKDVVAGTAFNCGILDNIPGNTQMERAKWLKENIKTFDDQLFKCVEKYHKIDSTVAENAIQEFYNNTAETTRSDPEFKLLTPVSVKEFNRFNFCSCYDAYIAFDIDAKNAISIKLINGFVEKPSCYSLPFLKGVINKNGMKDTDVFNFARGIFVSVKNGVETKEERIVIKVINNNAVNKKVVDYEYYDISDDPKKKMI